MKSVNLSEVVRIAAAPAGGGASRFALSLALGLPALVAVFHLLDPGAPLACIVLPVLAGALAPLLAVLPGRFDVHTRFEARHMVGSLDETLAALGFARVAQRRGAVLYRSKGARWLDKEVAVTVREHRIEVLGPVSTLRALQARLAC